MNVPRKPHNFIDEAEKGKSGLQKNGVTLTKSHSVPNAGMPASLQPCIVSELQP
jgi:hypothetical protein